VGKQVLVVRHVVAHADHATRERLSTSPERE